MALRHDPPTSEKDYDDAPANELRKAQGKVSPGKTTGMGTVAAVAGSAKTKSDEPLHDRASNVMSKASSHLAYHSHGGIHSVAGKR